MACWSEGPISGGRIERSCFSAQYARERARSWGRNDQIGVDDRIRVIAADKSFDFEFIVKGVAPGLGLLLEPAFASMPGHPAYRALMQISQAVRAETDAQRAEVNRQQGIAP